MQFGNRSRKLYMISLISTVYITSVQVFLAKLRIVFNNSDTQF